MIILPSKFATENAKADKTPAVIVKLLESELSSEQTTQADWTNNSAESNVDYATTPGDVVLATQAESYTPATGGTKIYDHTAVNMGGIMYRMGGVVSNVAPKVALATMKKYDIAADTWTSLADMPNARTGHIAVGDGSNLIYVGGGRTTRDTKDASVIYQDWNSYNTTTGTWTVLTPLPVRLFDSAAVHIDGKIYVINGATDSGVEVENLYVYDTASDSWSELASSPVILYTHFGFNRHSAVYWPNGGLSGQIIVYGGSIRGTFFDQTATNETWIYDRATDSWSQSISGPLSTISHAAVIIGDKMFVIGGKTLNVSPATYYANVNEFDLSTKTWKTLTPGSHTYARHTAVVEGTTVVIHAGRDDVTPYLDVNIYQAPVFFATGSITTQTVDLGAVPTVPGEIVLDDIVPTGTTLVYEGWKSTTGAFTGEEVYVGFLVDGQVVPTSAAAQYFRIKATLTADTGGLNSPTVLSIKVAFATYRSYADATGFGYEPALLGISSLTTSVDTFRPSTIGQMTVKLAFISSVSDYLKTKNPKNKIVKILAGFVASGFTEVDFIDFFQGQIDNWAITNKDEVTLTVKDFKKEWAVDVPAKWETTSDDVTWTTTHPADIILDILRNKINVRDSKIDISSFDILKASLPGWTETRTITGNPEQADSLIEELRGLMSAIFIPKGDGKISIKRFDAVEASVANITDNNTMNQSWTANGGSLINDVFVYTDYKGSGSSASDFGSLRIGVDVTSQVNYDEDAVKVIKDKWTVQGLNDIDTNGDFEAGNTTGWTLLVGGTAAATFAAAAAVPPFQGSWKGVVTITNIGTSVDDILIKQDNMSITQGHVYKIIFGITSDVNYAMQIKFRRSANPFSSYAVESQQTVNITPTYTVYEVRYTASVTASDLAIHFKMGLGPASINIDYVSIVDVSLDQTGDMMDKILARYATPPEKVTLDTDANLIALEVGDVVNLTARRAPSSDMAGVANKKFQIVNKNMDFKKNTNRLTLLRV